MKGQERSKPLIVAATAAREGPVASGGLPTVPADEYRLGPGDHIGISLPFADEINNKPQIIDTAGYINIAFAGRLRAAGLTTQELEAQLREKLSAYFESPAVVVNILEYGSQPVSVIGEVHAPAVHQLHGKMTLVEMLSASGGLTPEAGSRLEITRDRTYGILPLSNVHIDPSEKVSRAEIELAPLLSGNRDNILVCPNDILNVPRAKLIYVLGEVHKPGGFPLRENESASVLQALALAEGPLATAGTGNARILRGGPAGPRQEIPVNLRRVLNREQADLLLKPDDILYVPNSKAKSAALRGIETALQIGAGVVIWGRY
jgi:polysaccharide export outer membrane protein